MKSRVGCSIASGHSPGGRRAKQPRHQEWGLNLEPMDHLHSAQKSQAQGSFQIQPRWPQVFPHLPVALHSLAARPTPPWGTSMFLPAARPAPGFGRGAIVTARRAHYGWARRSQMAPTWCEYTLVSFCHLLLSLKNYISICFHTFLPPNLPSWRNTT